MKISFKFITFCVIAIILVVSYNSKIKAQQISAPQAGKIYKIMDLFELINTNNPTKSSNFLITDATNLNAAGKNSYNAERAGFTKDWAENNETEVTLQHDAVQIASLIIRGVIPNATILKKIKNNQKANAIAKKVVSDYSKIILYFTAKSPLDGKKYKLYIADPCPGQIIIAGSIVVIPAYTNVLSKWKVQ